ncbi:Thyroglobulin [Amphibalanus amphitrite]|uniref:Thyroglobulin n=1 Tax=Amphibalanus amphitrite TaxID=1232801 RepID=A0A6A4VNC1_AMPAM|nr:uncharacterized protein LOC122383041 [Amphibalanus amphitrite]KAF0297647.1 Thyroglobulin [Amphibalanus amphitrite]
MAVWWVCAPLCGLLLLAAPSVQQYQSDTPCLDARSRQGPPIPGQRYHDCDADGQFRPQQCVGSVCFCVDTLGEQMKQFEAVGRHEAHLVSCACARQKTLQAGRHGGQSVSCDRRGNFAPRQCVGSQCHCVDPLTGARRDELGSVHVSQIGQLRCGAEETGQHGGQHGGQRGQLGGQRGQLGGQRGQLGGQLGGQRGQRRRLGAPDRLGRPLLGGNTPCWDELRQHEARSEPLLGVEKPNCDRTGRYHPKQCKGSECFCVDPNNAPLPRYRASRAQGAAMGCLCSRREWELQQGGLLGLSVNCDELGNFAPHQCVGSRCHCVEAVTGERLPGLEAHVADLRSLDCAAHRRQLLGAGRSCEEERRRTPAGQPQPECDRTGKFAPVQCSGDLCRCVSPDGETLEGYDQPIQYRASMSCACARRSWEASRDGLGHPVVCDKFGGFHSHQCEGSTCYCVDPASGQPAPGGTVHVSQLASLRCGEQRPALGSRQPCWQERRRREQLQTASARPLLGLELPQCDRSGHYEPRQCTGSECYCVDAEGTRLSGYQGGRQHQHQMHCVCARLKEETRALGLVGTSTNCDSLGNFERRQCRGSQCFCVDPHTGGQVSAQSVHIAQLSALDCSGSGSGSGPAPGGGGRPLLGGGRRRLGEDGSGQRVRPGQGGRGVRVLPGQGGSGQRQLLGGARRLGEDGAGVRVRPGQGGRGVRILPGQDGSGQRVFPGQDGSGQRIRPGQDGRGQRIFPGQDGSGQRVFPGQDGSGQRIRPGQDGAGTQQLFISGY